MFKPIHIIGIVVFFILGLFSLSFSQESMTITTYYPSPYGSYRQLSATSPDGANLTTFLVTIRNEDATGGQSHGLLIQAGNNSNDLPLQILNRAGTTEFLRVRGDGNVGIGIASPTAKLHVAGNIKASLNDIDGGSPANMRYNSGTNEIGYDIAELFETNEEVEPGDVLCIDENGKLKKNTVAYDTKVAGVVSEAPAILFEGSQLQIAPQPFEFKGGSKPPLALAGRVKCKVIVQETGPIKMGDLLVTSSKPGFATKADTEKVHIGTVLGKALESLNEGEGKILILVTLQ